ncbi:exodeoxyribonuclease III [Methylocystis bryophila]|uniref:Exodeoxyribonuclease III n=1 Tax=Methylocystis bryophila TaxID=655015 RepID=A0A1W6MV82_9HYPH|nr:exodeoxyribonuclease III [Methylocystis bryophila]ARN81477.1 exodeoxyribonuclease III [Methylocystis bryophila]BDV37492.1 exodeoxyribonuclease III [Methylocystis bryophila]
MRIASWNVNSVRLRLPALLGYLKEKEPDVLALQELKCQDEAFPRQEIEDAGYNVAVFGQKALNGVALLTKTPLEDVSRGLPGFEDPQSRYIEGAVTDGSGEVWRVASIYLPNGNPPESEKYPYKLAFMDALAAHARKLLTFEEKLVLAGDYNVIPAPEDVYDPKAWVGDALFLPQTRARFNALLNLGFTEALRATSDAAGLYTFWDYQAGCWQKDKGLRIDHLLLSPQAADRLQSVAIDKELRGAEKPSDHVPIRAVFG